MDKVERVDPAHGAQEPRGALFDRRKRTWTCCPNYVIDVYARLIGTTAVALYLVLCRFAGQKDACWPAAETLAERLGVSVGTVWRQLGCLIHYGLVTVEVRFEDGRQTVNLYTLTDPCQDPAALKAYDNAGGRGALARQRRTRAGAPAGGAPARPTGGAPARHSGGAPARHKGDLKEGDLKEVCVDPPPAVPTEIDLAADCRHLVALWLNLLAPGSPGFAAAQKTEIRREVDSLLRAGHTVQSLEESMRDPNRDCSEWPRLFRDRIVGAVKPRKTYEQRVAEALATRAARTAQERADDADLLAAGGIRAAIDRLRGRTAQNSPGNDRPDTVSGQN